MDLAPVRLVRRLRAGEHGADRLELLVAGLREIALCEPVRAEILRTLAEQARFAVRAEHCGVFVSLGDQITAVAESGDVAMMSGQTFPVRGTLAGLALTTGHAYVCTDGEHDDRLLSIDFDGYRVGSAVTVPVEHNGVVAAVLSVSSSALGAFDDRDAHVLTELTTAAAARLSHAVTVENLREREQDLERMSAERMALSAARRAILTDDAAAISVCRVARDLTGAALVSLLLPTADGRLELAAWDGFTPESSHVPLDGSTVVADVFRTAQARIVWVRDPGGIDLDAVTALERSTGTPLTGALYVPLLGRDGCMGVLVATMTTPLEARHATLLGTLELLAGEAVIALQREDLVYQLAEQASTDALTSLANRRAWDTTLDLEVARSARTGQPLCVALLDLDNFKAYNDAKGHPAGDALLVEVTRAWRRRLRTSDVLARYGGEEFALLLPNTDVNEGQKVVEELRALVPSGQT
ncbi:MAG TPA: sensor domain-containing diguanylate cyclase, partial [Mycobacteriales bacterium]|nr:sensor domain-containing diguanylate cyclase [Mycobacteriales bacterium]